MPDIVLNTFHRLSYSTCIIALGVGIIMMMMIYFYFTDEEAMA